MIKYDGDRGTPIPVYVTRETADGSTGTYSMPFHQSFKAMILVYANMVLWGTLGLIGGSIVLVNWAIDLVNMVSGLI